MGLLGPVGTRRRESCSTRRSRQISASLDKRRHRCRDASTANDRSLGSRLSVQPTSQFSLAIGPDYRGDDVTRVQFGFGSRSDQSTVSVDAEHEAARRPWRRGDCRSDEDRGVSYRRLDQDRAAIRSGEQTQRASQPRW